ncbi:MAG: CDP-diacylglycerol--glycerol-3-phosphate 3-phosphatidyltransferase [Deltaproteobacteria bacterium]|nr:CDP-diacylglycerol--glycerol-3-phosphate 3-phosphatidyltransferase [Deltaproteobacteria bacterium]
MLNLPNTITLVRIAFIPVLFVLLLFPGKTVGLFAALSFLVASLTDFLDGFLARRQNSVTRLGKVLDPLADKLLITVCLIMLIPLRSVPAWIVAVIVCREVAVTGLRGIAAAEGMIIPAESWGKKKTAFQIVAIISLLLHYEYFYIDCHQVGMALLYIALALTVLSGLLFFYWFFQKISLSQ